jgi:transposase InsO family protein
MAHLGVPRYRWLMSTTTARRRAPARKILEALADFLACLSLSQARLAAELALYRAQDRILGRPLRRLHFDDADRAILVTLARLVPDWRRVVWIVTPDTIRRWARDGWRSFWRKLSRGGARARRSSRRVADDVRALIVYFGCKNLSWGAKRIVGELWTKLSIRVSKRTVQRVLREAGRPRRRPKGSQSWITFFKNHLPFLWSCDFFTVKTALFGELYVFFVLELATRRVLHWNVTQNPTRPWVAQQLREAVADRDPPRFLLRDRDGKYGPDFDAILASGGGRVLLTPPGVPQANAHAERLVKTLRVECLDHFLFWREDQVRWALKEYLRHYHDSRPRQGLAQEIPSLVGVLGPPRPPSTRLLVRPILNGLINEYSAAA